ncbi:hypothetical protein DITRI_Ditri14bG0020300 [Diplodiscus trichospermus]
MDKGLGLVRMSRSAASSDSVWGGFLPSDYLTILSDSSASLTFSSKKDLFFYLSHNHILIDQGKKSFSLDKWRGKKNYMIAPRDLVIIWGDTPEYWVWVSHPASGFKEVAMLELVWWLEIHAKISTSKLSLDTNNAAYLVFKLQEEEAYGFDDHPAEASLTLGADKICTKSVFLDPLIERRPHQGHPWYSYQPAEIDHSIMSCLECTKAGVEKCGLVVQGIEIRPKEDSPPIDIEVTKHSSLGKEY